MFFTSENVPDNQAIITPKFITQSMRDYVDQVVAFMLRYYYIDDRSSTDFGDAWQALRVMGVNADTQRKVSPLLKRVEGFDYNSVKYVCDAMSIILGSRYTNSELATLAYHTLTNAFQSIAYLSNKQPIYGFIRCEYGDALGINPMHYAAKSFLTNGTLTHVICAKKGLSTIDTRLLSMHYILATESRLTFAGTEQVTEKMGEHYITHLALVLATGETVWKAKVADIPCSYVSDYKTELMKRHKSKLKGCL